MRQHAARARPLLLVCTAVVLTGLCCTCCAVPPRQTPDVPPRFLSLTDYADVFDRAATVRVNSALLDVKASLAVDFEVLIIANTAGMSIEEYAGIVYRAWGMDQAVRSSSVLGALLLMLAVENNQWYLVLSSSLQHDLSRDLTLKLWERAKRSDEAKLADRIETFVKLLSDQLQQTRGFPK